jgi:transposase-like protein
VTTDGAAAYPPALAAVLPAVLQETGKAPQQRIARDHQHRKGRVRGMRGCSALGALLAALRRGVPAMVAAWEAFTADLLTW